MKETHKKIYNIFSEVPLTSIKPNGHLKSFLETQNKGLSGNLEVAGYPFNTHLWAGKMISALDGAAWWPYEQTAYWIDGFTRLGFLIDDKELQKKAAEQVSYVLGNADKDGYLGPRNSKEYMVCGRWPHAVFFRALTAYSSATDDNSIAKALRNHYLGGSYDYSYHRNVCNIEAMCWAYGETGDKALIEMAEKTWHDFQAVASKEKMDLQTEAIYTDRPVHDTHGVTYMEISKLGAVLYLYTGKQEYLEYTKKANDKLNKYHILPSGVPSSSERVRGITSLDAHELCDVSDYLWSLGYLFMATGEAAYADRIEQVAYNALPGQVTNDFKQHQYFSSPNQVVLGPGSTHTEEHTGTAYMCFRPKPGTECCTGQAARPTPNFVSRMWMFHKGGPAAVFYGPSTFNFELNGTAVKINQETNYPFRNDINFHIQTEKAVSFPFTFRIPSWAEKAELFKNGKKRKFNCKPGNFITIKETFESNDLITLKLQTKIKISQWPNNGVTLSYGALLFALPIKERREIDKDDKNQSKDFPAYNMYPDSPWNYALNLSLAAPEKFLRLELCECSTDPWSNPPVKIFAKAKRVQNWKVKKCKTMNLYESVMTDPDKIIWEKRLTTIEGDFEMTPPLPDPENLTKNLAEQEEEIALIPYGCTQLRVSMFPHYCQPTNNKVNRKDGKPKMNKLKIIPQPSKIKTHAKNIDFNGKFKIYASNECKKIEEQLKSVISFAENTDKSIELKIDSNLKELGEEGYRLVVNETGFLLTAYSLPGMFYASRTLIQLLPPEFETGQIKAFSLPELEIEDNPRFAWRGLMVDTSRHFQSVSALKTIIDRMASLKLNRFHWHIMDNQSCRIQLEDFPELAAAALAAKSPGIYSPQEIREIIAYGAERYITVYPEIEIPGHSQSILTTYPELHCQVTEEEKKPHKQYCLGNSNVQVFLKKFISQIVKIFEPQFLHIGGDEAESIYWKKCPLCSKQLKDLKLDNFQQYQKLFMKEIATYVKQLVPESIEWAEHLEIEMPKKQIIQTWHEGEAEDALKAGHRIICSEHEFVYFDYPQNSTESYREVDLPLENVYKFDPIPPNTSNPELILGGEACIWTEDIPEKILLPKTFPRLFAFAETVWSEPSQREYTEFLSRVNTLCSRFDILGIDYCKMN